MPIPGTQAVCKIGRHIHRPEKSARVVFSSVPSAFQQVLSASDDKRQLAHVEGDFWGNLVVACKVPRKLNGVTKIEIFPGSIDQTLTDRCYHSMAV